MAEMVNFMFFFLSKIKVGFFFFWHLLDLIPSLMVSGMALILGLFVIISKSPTYKDSIEVEKD